MTKVISLFSGIGAMDLGFQNQGFEIAFQCEINNFCLQILNKNFPDVPKHKDIRTLQAENLPIADIMIGGFPCQDISQGNTEGIGLKGNRSGLWYQYLRLINSYRPSMVVIENVESIRYFRRGLAVLLQDLTKIGYDCEWQILSAAMFGGIHRRRRIFIIAYPNSKGMEGRTKKQIFRKSRLDFFINDSINKTRAERSGLYQPKLLRNSNGASDRVDRVRSLGNSIFLPCVEFVAYCIKESINE
jgi:DNA (cytosine-5)-methyltransferase 1